ncbi:MAG: hydrogenase maturation protease [Nitriliruptorales bacterium]|nr:hydrogenase maturation protease [Nitriliruptorales bacterium]
MSTLVIGIGNRDRGDDAVGLEVADHLRRLGTDAVIITWQGPDVDLLDVVRGFDRVIIIDAMHSGARPGTIRHFVRGRDPLPGGTSIGSSHALGLQAVLELAAALGIEIDWELYAIETEDVGYDRPLSPGADTAAATLARQLHAELDAKRPVGPQPATT